MANAIKSDDPQAIEKLEQKLAALEDYQARLKAVTAAWRKAGKPKADNADAWNEITKIEGIGENLVSTLLRGWRMCPYHNQPVPAYLTTNNGAEIRRCKKRIAEVAEMQQAVTKEEEREGGIRIVENAEDNRLQIFFPGKPDADRRQALKNYGFKWAPSVGAWQRQLNNNARWAAERALAA